MIDRETTRLEARLAAAIRHVDAPEGMSARIMERVQGMERDARVVPWPRTNAWTARVAAAVFLLSCLTGSGVYWEHQQLKAAEAARQFETAMRITNRALTQTKEHLSRAGLRFAD